MEDLVKNVKNILLNDYKVNKNTTILIVYDNECKLNTILKEAYTKAAENLQVPYLEIDFNLKDPLEIHDYILENTTQSDVIVLLQTSSFRVSKYRWRNELCSKGLKVIEHPQLGKIREDEIQTYINSLTYDKEHYDSIANYLEEKISKAEEIKILSQSGQEIFYKGEMDFCVRNTGDLDKQTNWGCRYPIGELISEAKDLSILNGEIEVYAYPDIETQETTFVDPFTITIENGFVISHTGPEEFNKIIELIKTENDEELVYVRELGMGLNRHIRRFSRLGDAISYERQEGLHFSLGMKHGIYQKKLWPKFGKKFHQRFHIDVYVNMKDMFIDGVKVYEFQKGYFIKE